MQPLWLAHFLQVETQNLLHCYIDLGLLALQTSHLESPILELDQELSLWDKNLLRLCKRLCIQGQFASDLAANQNQLLDKDYRIPQS